MVEEEDLKVVMVVVVEVVMVVALVEVVVVPVVASYWSVSKVHSLPTDDNIRSRGVRILRSAI